MAKTTTMSANARKIMDFLKANGVGTKFTHNEVKDALGFEKVASVVGTITSFTKKGFVVKSKETREVMNADGAPVAKEVICLALTDAGMNFDPDAVVAE